MNYLPKASRSECVLTAPEVVCRPLIAAFGLVTVPVPVELPLTPIVANWHQRYDTDAGHAWHREQTRTVLATILGTGHDAAAPRPL